MNSYSLILLTSILVPLGAALLMLVFGGMKKGPLQFLATIGFFYPAAAAVLLWTKFNPMDPSGYDFVMDLNTGLEALGISLHLGLNGISLPLFALAGIVGLAAGLYAMQSGAERLQQYLMLVLFMQAGLMGVFASIDVFFFYFLHELALIPTFLCIGIWGGRDRQSAAMEMTIYLTLGAMLSLLGLLALYFQSGAESFDMISLKEALTAAPLSDTVQNNIFGLLLFGFGILVSLFPLHSWAPRGYGASPTSIAMLHAGVLKKFGIYGFIQVALPLVPKGIEHWGNIMGWLALGSVVIIGFVTMAQRDLKQMVGYSSVMHMGYAFLGIASMSVIGIGGVVVLMVAHGLTVALLFLLGHCVFKRTETYDMDDMGGLVKQAPALAALFSTAVLASIALPGPGLLNFWAEFSIFVALWEYNTVFVFIAATGIIISAIYGLRAIARIFFGPPSEPMKEYLKENSIKDITLSEKIPVLLLLLALIALGLWPRSFTDATNKVLEDSLNNPQASAMMVEEGSELAQASLPLSLED